MKANVGDIDRGLSIGVGLALIVAVLSGVIGMWGWIGILPLATGMFGFCPAYLPFRLNSCRIKQ